MVRLSFTIYLAVLTSSALASQQVFGPRETIENGSPLYDCHEACGEVILMAEQGNYCSNSNYTSDLSTCLKCAATCEIWKYYGTEVKSAAANCSDSATPSSSSASSCASTIGAVTAAATSTGSTTGTASTTGSTATSTGAGSVVQQNIALTGVMSLFVWSLVV
ncbi:hypothetical protein N7520_010389 [Penicillium odoratum]|uniref:uncharacterized protein n=1 Tax=Penicillium odoratum TaxID=1167516 RepID=UPI002548DB4A|nr:uncharacterized protein N7520_010389 [Penicillium odoratum]KAJ5745207.1 hypothetical protein N7520_010389 [Penicillium odoratum]